jgi:hypothetical protein
MKKVFIAITALFLVASVSSCKKNWTCSCTVSIGGVSTPYSYPIDNATKSTATSACNSYVTTVSAYGGNATCTLN